ncbi:MAG: hypothetical protein AMXMBFR47_43920 [Planctomycetota bacterium]
MHFHVNRHGARAVIVVGAAALTILVLGQTASRPAGKAAPLVHRRVAAAKSVYEQLVVEPLKRGEARASAEETYLWSKRWMEAEQDAAADRPAALAAAEAHLTRMTELAHRAKTMYEAGQTGLGQVTSVEFYQIDAEWSAAKYRAK